MLREKSCGVVPFRKVEGRILYLVVSSAVTKREHWEFPKGGVEEGEREIDTALRELREETGVTDVRVLPGFREPIRYIYRRPEGLVSKQVVYFIGRVGSPEVTLREVECKDYRWADYDEAFRLLRHANARILLERCHAFITGRPLPPRPQRRGPAPPPAERSETSGTPQEGQQQTPPQRAEAQQQGEAPRRRRRRRRRGRRGQTAPAENQTPAKPPEGEGS